MKITFMSALLVLALLLPLSGLAESNGGTIQLASPVQIGGTQLKPGTYKVEWSGTGPAVQVNFLRHNKTVATAQGKIVDHQRPSPYDDVVIGPLGNTQQKTISEIDFDNRKEALLISPNGTTPQTK
jgi:hypothetical protein